MDSKKKPAGPPMVFDMPFMKPFVPKALWPWIYLSFAIIFQCTQIVNAGNMAELMSDHAFLREDVMMIVFFGLVGINLPFPFLFRYKFHFSNKSMISSGVMVLIACIMLAQIVTWLPALCVINFIGGYFKLWTTFECFSNIQLWMTKKRDFSIFFPLLYMIVLNAIEVAPLLTAYSGFYHDYHVIGLINIALLWGVLLFMATCTRHFHFMKPMPLFGMDWLGMFLWAAFMLQLCYIFNYGEHYNWLDSPRIWGTCLTVIPTAYFAINRERHVHHPFIDPACWRYPKVVTMLLLFLGAEVIVSITNVCQNAFIGTLGFDSLHVANLNGFSIIGNIMGCLISLLWIHFLRLSYVRLTAVSFAFMVASVVIMYFRIAIGINIEQFYLPTILMNIGYAIIFCSITIYLQQAMPFQHFFMGLTIMGFVRTGAGAAFGGAIYGYAMRWSMADNISKYSGLFTDVHLWGTNISEEIGVFMQQMLLVSTKQIYGITCIVGIFAVLYMLMYSVPVKSTLKKMPYWSTVAHSMKKDK